MGDTMLYKVEENCTGCGICAEVCELNLITVHDSYIEIDVDKCTHCSKCIESCPSGVFTKKVIFKHFLTLFYNKITGIF